MEAGHPHASLSVLCSPLEKDPSGCVAPKMQRAGEPVQRQSAVLLSSHPPPEHPSVPGQAGHTGMTPRLSLPDTALGQPERGPAHVRVSSLLHQGRDNKVRARFHAVVGALSISQCLTSQVGSGVTAVTRLGTVPRASPKCIPKVQIPKILVLQCTKGCSCQLQGGG